ncbi:MAG: hypothetical protein LPK09_02700 [Hymenobacteraceae bacterium]|nr:hypothetical protein [Hymenobacteraceae bacterium]
MKKVLQVAAYSNVRIILCSCNETGSYNAFEVSCSQTKDMVFGEGKRGKGL